MKKTLFVVALVLCCGLVAFAQDFKKAEVFGGYQWTSVDAGSGFDRQNFNQLGNQFSRGDFEFQPNATALNGKGGDSFAEFLLGDLYTSTVAVSDASERKPSRNRIASGTGSGPRLIRFASVSPARERRFRSRWSAGLVLRRSSSMRANLPEPAHQRTSAGSSVTSVCAPKTPTNR